MSKGGHINDTNFGRSDSSRSDLHSDFDNFLMTFRWLFDDFSMTSRWLFDNFSMTWIRWLELDEVNVSYTHKVVHGAMLKNVLSQTLKRQSAYQNLIYFRTYAEDHFHIFDLLEKGHHFELVRYCCFTSYFESWGLFLKMYKSSNEFRRVT